MSDEYKRVYENEFEVDIDRIATSLEKMELLIKELDMLDANTTSIAQSLAIIAAHINGQYAKQTEDIICPSSPSYAEEQLEYYRRKENDGD